MKTAQELKEEMKALQTQIKNQEIKEEQERIRIKEEEKAKLKKSKMANQILEKQTQEVKDLVAKIVTKKELKERLKYDLNLIDLTKSNGVFYVKVIKATTQEERQLLKWYIYNPLPTNITKKYGEDFSNIAMAQRAIKRAKKEKALEEEWERNRRVITKRDYMRNLNQIAEYIPTKWMRDYGKNKIKDNLTYLTQFLSEEQAKVKLEEMVKPKLEKQKEEQMVKWNEKVEKLEKELRKAKESIEDIKNINIKDLF